MADGPLIASIASLIGDPARANRLTALMNGRALTARELAEAGGIAPPTASGHLARLVEAGLLDVRSQGRHRYYRLSGSDVAETLEALMGLAQRTGAVPVRTGPRDAALRESRLCYDHLAGERGVALLESLQRRKMVDEGDTLQPNDDGRAFLADLGIKVDELARGRRPLSRACLDWSERRSHLGGTLGAAIFEHMLTRKWAVQSRGSRIVRFAKGGEQRIAAWLAD
jgi:DNA-binding transcriptional ArsR family regulator